MAEVDLPSGELQPPFVDDEIRHAALDAAMAGLAADENLAVSRQQRCLHRDLNGRILVDLNRTRFSSPGRSDVMEDSVVHSLLQSRRHVRSVVIFDRRAYQLKRKILFF